ncbi:MAG: hypothetical protein Q9160_002063 [Pyrenula sp. 1 TL-2023]
MSFVLSTQQESHEGEKRMRNLRHSKRHENPTSPFLTPGAAFMLQTAPLLALGTLDSQGRPWATLWGGESGFARSMGQSIVGVRTIVDPTNDPVVEALYEGRDDGETVRPEGAGKMVSGLTIDMENRKRVKVFGRMMAGALSMSEKHDDKVEPDGATGEAQLVLRIEQSLGNCPKYITSRHIAPNIPQPKLLSNSPLLTTEALDIISTADTLFIASANNTHDMDCNIRGGPPGFIRVLPSSSSTQPSSVIWPEYSGNLLYQTLGNLTLYPKAGLVIPSFSTSSVLYLTGTTTIHHGASVSALLPHTNLAVQLTITSARLVANGLPFRGIDSPNDSGLSPYNPPIRYLATEVPPAAELSTPTTATLLESKRITPTITHHRFSLSTPQSWTPGQHIALSFAADLDIGYSHMRDDDPRSLNDDWVRTFTICSAAPATIANNAASDKADASETATSTKSEGKTTEFEILIRSVGPVTRHLAAHAQQRQQQQQRGIDLKASVNGFGGSFCITHSENENAAPPTQTQSPFIASGVGITPLLSQLHILNPAHLTLFWSVAAADIDLVKYVLREWPALAPRLTLFVTGGKGGMEGLESMGVGGVRTRRMGREDLKSGGGFSSGDVYVCTGPGMRREVLGWVGEEARVHYEDFGY